MNRQMSLQEYRSNYRNNYIIPAKMLLGLVIKTGASEDINSASLKIIKEVEENKEIKAMLFNLSKKMSEVVNKKGYFVIVPGFMPPEKSEDYRKSITDFIETLVKSHTEKNQ